MDNNPILTDEKITHNPNRIIIFSIILIIALIELLNTAWHSDDFLITMRTVLNFINGYGPVFNIDERVQAYTHPLWFLLLSGVSLLFKNVLASMYLLSIGLSLGVIWLIGSKIALNFWGGILSVCVLICSKAYVDFSTSGLENPLSHLLLLVNIIYGLKATKPQDVNHETSIKTLSLFFLTSSLLYLTRPDLPLLIFPISMLVIFNHYHTPRLLIKSIIIGALPCITWTIFSLYYYGFPFPNTAYAKLGTGISLHELLSQGLKYFKNSLTTDPLTLLFIYIGTFVGLCSSRFNTALVSGIWLYFIYILSIGGDFMSGRFFTAPLLVAVVLVSRSNLSKQKLGIIALLLSVLAIKNIGKTIFSDTSYANIQITNGIADERGFYFQNNSLLRGKMPMHYVSNWRIQHKSLRIGCGGLGFTGIAQGPGAYIIDSCALSDPLLARLPAKYQHNWRIGHFLRELPAGYQDSIKTNSNLIIDPIIKDLYDSIRMITRGRLNDLARIKKIIQINTRLSFS